MESITQHKKKTKHEQKKMGQSRSIEEAEEVEVELVAHTYTRSHGWLAMDSAT